MKLPEALGFKPTHSMGNMQVYESATYPELFLTLQPDRDAYRFTIRQSKSGNFFTSRELGSISVTTEQQIVNALSAKGMPEAMRINRPERIKNLLDD